MADQTLAMLALVLLYGVIGATVKPVTATALKETAGRYE